MCDKVLAAPDARPRSPDPPGIPQIDLLKVLCGLDPRPEEAESVVRLLAKSIPRRLLRRAIQLQEAAELSAAANAYYPDVRSHPVDTIRETLEAQGKDWRHLATEGGLMKQHALFVWRGTAHITPAVAEALEKTTGVPSRFWIARQQQYTAWAMGKGG